MRQIHTFSRRDWRDPTFIHLFFKKRIEDLHSETKE